MSKLDEPDSLLKFRLLVAMSEQFGYHFAKTCEMAGDPKNQDPVIFGQKLFGGTLKMQVIDAKS